MSNSRALQGGIFCLSYVCVRLCVPTCVQGCVCVCVCTSPVWECDRQNETSQQKMLGRQSILLTKVCGYSPRLLCASREAAAGSGWGRARGVWTHTHRGPSDAGLCCLFYDTWQDNESIAPLKISPKGALSLCIFSVEECFFLKIHREQCHQMSI